MTDEPRCPAVLWLGLSNYLCVLSPGHPGMHQDKEGNRWRTTGVDNVPPPVAAPGPFVEGALEALAERITRVESVDAIREDRSRRLRDRVAALAERIIELEAREGLLGTDTAPKEPASQLVYSPDRSPVCDTVFTDAEEGSVWKCTRDAGHPGRHGVPQYRVIEAESRTCGCGCGAPTRD